MPQYRAPVSHGVADSPTSRSALQDLAAIEAEVLRSPAAHHHPNPSPARHPLSAADDERELEHALRVCMAMNDELDCSFIASPGLLGR